ncbi:MAG: hypothetical protein GF331_11880 [Chitinivibrionales bacterium]|nr:hypothetical protein [Chitinivibrionales bacterium]
MNARDRFQAVMQFGDFDRLPVVEWAGWWDKTIERWHAESLPRSLDDRYEICRHFGLDQWLQTWFRAVHWECPRPEEGPLVGSMDDYERLRPWLYPWPSPQIDEYRRLAALRRAEGAVLWCTFEGPFWFPRTLLGIEQHLYAFYEQPELMQRIIDDQAAYVLRLIDEICRIERPDFVTLAEDMSFRGGPMLGVELFEQYIAPFCRHVLPSMRDRGVWSFIDTDGDITLATQWYVNAGADGILPVERQAGTDIAALRAQLPRVRYVGGFDKLVMDKGEAAMREEFERLMPIASQGGFVIACDHQTPPQVSYDDYLLYIRLMREYGALVAV